MGEEDWERGMGEEDWERGDRRGEMGHRDEMDTEMRQT